MRYNVLFTLLLPLTLLSSLPLYSQNVKTEKAIFAGGCFWCMQPPFDKAKGVISTTVGYCGGKEKNPTYEQVSYGRTSHVESIEVTFNPKVISYGQLIDIFWRNINPTQTDGQFADIGAQYKTYIYYLNPEQKRIAEAAKDKLNKSGKFKDPIATRVAPATTFYAAEDYHQKYYLKNPDHYNAYKKGSGRKGYIERVWGTKD